MKVLIVGGGIAGLVLANKLARQEIEVQVFEKVSRYLHVGGGLILKSPAVVALEKAGLLDRVRARGLELTRHEVLDETGQQLGVMDFEPMYARGFARGILIHRANFQDILKDALPPGVLHLGAPVTAWELRPDGVKIEVTGVGIVEGDVLVGADGLHSQVREQLTDFVPHALNFRSYRWVVPNRDGADHFMEFMGHGMALGYIPLNAEELFLWLSIRATPQARVYSDPADLKQLMSQFTHPKVLSAMEQLTDPAQLLCTDIHEVTMEEYHCGRCVLIGDAAHAMSPSMGTGSALAMGDAVVLAEELARVQSGQQSYDEAFATYYDRRMPKVEAMRALTRAVDAEHHAEHEDVIRRRNRRLRSWLADVPGVQAELEHSLGGGL